MKALEILLRRAQHKNISVKQEMEQQVQGQDALAVVPSLGSLASESKAEVGEGQVSCGVCCRALSHLSAVFFHLPICLTLGPSFIPQDCELLQQCELFRRKGALFSFPGHDEHGEYAT